MKKFLGFLFLSVSLSACTLFGDDNAAAVSNPEEQTPQASAAVVKKDGAELSKQDKTVYDQLAKFAAEHINRSNKNIVPNKKSPKVEKINNMYVASYVEFDPDSLTMELIPTPHRQYKYLAKIKYRERLYQSKAESKQSALKGKFSVVGGRFITEVPRYKQGKWSY